MNRVELFEKMGFAHLSLHTYVNEKYQTVHNFRKSTVCSEEWRESIVCVSYPDKTNWYIYGEEVSGDLGKTDIITFEEVFNELTPEQQEAAIWHLDILR